MYRDWRKMTQQHLGTKELWNSNAECCNGLKLHLSPFDHILLLLGSIRAMDIHPRIEFGPQLWLSKKKRVGNEEILYLQTKIISNKVADNPPRKYLVHTEMIKHMISAAIWETTFCTVLDSALLKVSSFAFIINEEQDFEAQNGSSNWRNSSSLVRNVPLDSGICLCDTWLLYSEDKSESPISLWLASSLLHPSGQGSSTWENSILLGMVELSHELEVLRLNKLSRERRIFFLRLNTLERKDMLPRNRANYSCWAGTEL